MSRIGLWQQTLPFALNNKKEIHIAESEYFALPNTNALTVLSEWFTNGSDPSGSRHLTSHASFIRPLASGYGPQPASLAFGAFDLQSTDISIGSGVSKTKVMLFRAARFTSPGITRISNMKVWAADTTDFLEPQTHRILYSAQGAWASGFNFVPGDMGNRDYWLSPSLPDIQNLFSTDGKLYIVGSGDADVSQWMYLALAASGTMPLGEYGDVTDGPDGFNIRVTYNIDNLGQVTRLL